MLNVREWERKWTEKNEIFLSASTVDFRQSIQYSLWIKTRPQSSCRPCKMAQVSHHQACVRLQESKECQTAARVTEQFISESSFSQLLAKVPVISGTQGFIVSSQWFPTTCMSRNDQVMQSSGHLQSHRLDLAAAAGLTHYTSDLLFNCDSHRPRLTVVVFTFITHLTKAHLRLKTWCEKIKDQNDYIHRCTEHTCVWTHITIST